MLLMNPPPLSHETVIVDDDEAGDGDDSLISVLLAMGFDASASRDALERAKGDVEVATDMLLNPVPNEVHHTSPTQRGLADVNQVVYDQPRQEGSPERKPGEQPSNRKVRQDSPRGRKRSWV